jgi:hypothetical protein
MKAILEIVLPESCMLCRLCRKEKDAALGQIFVCAPIEKVLVMKKVTDCYSLEFKPLCIERHSDCPLKIVEDDKEGAQE